MNVSQFLARSAKSFILILTGFLTTACVSPPPPADLNNVCHIFRQYPQWYRAAKDVEHRWRVPVSVQMAIMHQESKFDAKARPPCTKIFCVIPWKRPSTAYGYAQALNGTWKEYKYTNGSVFTSRHSFADGADFIGWYANLAHRKAGIDRSDAYALYLAYHEGVGGYQRQTYLKKAWLPPVARKVSVRAQMYAMQLNSCRHVFDSRSWI